MSLYDVAREICHDLGVPWHDPRTGERHDPPASKRNDDVLEQIMAANQWFEIDGQDCLIHLMKRPHY